MKSFDISSAMLPTSEEYGFGMDGYWVWCGSAMKGADGLWHMYSARWPKSRPFFTGYIVSSEIIHAVADRPEGPYRFREVVLGARGEEFWDGRMTHNPSVVCSGGVTALFYIGATFSGETPDRDALCGSVRPAAVDECYSSIRIGVAVLGSSDGEWRRFDEPVFLPDPDGWDRTVVTNPAPCVCPDGSVLMYYRSNCPDGMRIGVARCDRLTADEPPRFYRFIDHPLFENYPELHVEDPFVWHNGENFEMIAKDMNGNGCGVVGGGVHLVSEDGVDWDYAPQRLAYSRTLSFADGTSHEVYHLERPNILFDGGRPVGLAAAYGTAGGEKQPYGGKFDEMRDSRTIVIPFGN
ncbi:MAG: glycoside hydrolase family protein [Eubacteriales bacterium]|nr:glycoside hydrolase family protein [Clostridiales bacterium]MDD7301521.1 glycoside hydrolase family protein [Eubacteriales bacterium]MDY4435070.1 glycoside hydrolase family protein [Candidatus Flemingibacterium sp.]